MTYAAQLHQAIPEKHGYKPLIDEHFGPSLDAIIDREPEKRTYFLGRQIKKFHLALSTDQNYDLVKFCNDWIKKNNEIKSDVMEALKECANCFYDKRVKGSFSKNPLLKKVNSHYIKMEVSNLKDFIMGPARVANESEKDITYVISAGKMLNRYVDSENKKFIPNQSEEAFNYCIQLCETYLYKNLPDHALELINQFGNVYTVKEMYKRTVHSDKPAYVELRNKLLTHFPQYVNPPAAPAIVPSVTQAPVLEEPEAEKPTSGLLGRICEITFYGSLIAIPASLLAFIFSPVVAIGLLALGIIVAIGSHVLGSTLRNEKL